jgi:non-ribosomal peptide synthetase component E (peptide arylation enzyme)
MALKTGAKLVLLESFNAEQALQVIEEERITYAVVAPAQLAKMLDSPQLEKHDYSSLMCFHSSTAPLMYEVAMLIEKKMRTKVLNSLGGQDLGSICSTSLDDSQEVRIRTVGKPNRGVNIKLVDESGCDVSKGIAGKIIIKSASSSSGYYKDTENTWKIWNKDGWCHTRDIGIWDEQGDLVIVGREDSVIIRGGQNIYPGEIESLILTHPNVSMAVIVPMPDPIMGEKMCAYVVPKVGMNFTFDEMTSFLRSKKIAPYKLPERLEVVNELPLLGDMMKIDRKALVEDIRRKLKI